MDLLLLFLSQEKDLLFQATALRCLHFIFMRGVVYSSVSAHGIKTFSRIVDEADLPLSMQCEALQILHKVISESNLSSNDLAFGIFFETLFNCRCFYIDYIIYLKTTCLNYLLF